MQKLLDILASGVHDAKNQLFLADSIIAGAEKEHAITLAEARYAIEAAADRLSRALTAYRLLREGATLAITPVFVGDICDEVGLAQGKHLAAKGVVLSVACEVRDEWPLDRDLVIDMLNNAVQNAGRFARTAVRLAASVERGELLFVVEDDGPGYATLPPAMGTGLTVAARLAEIHARHGRQGELLLSNGGTLGGARFELRLP